MKIIKSPSPNFSDSDIELVGVMLHKSLGLMPWTLQWLRNHESKASAHILFARNGDIHELVPHNKRAWGSGRISNPSARGKKILDKFPDYKPGHFLLQGGFECLANQTFTAKQYRASVWYFRNKLKFKVNEFNLFTHRDFTSYKPKLEKEESKILRRIKLRDTIETLTKQLRLLLMRYVEKLKRSLANKTKQNEKV